MHYFYVLRFKKNKKLYYGFTNNLRRRIVEHKAGKSSFTSQNGPFDLTTTQSQAVLHTLRSSYRNPIIDRYPGAFGELIRTPEESLEKTDFAQKLKVVHRLVERFNQIRR